MRFAKAGALLASAALAVTGMVGVTGAQAAPAPAPKAVVAGAATDCASQTVAHQMVHLKFDWFTEGHGVIYVLHCQELRIEDGGLDVRCTSGSNTILQQLKPESEWQDFLGKGFGEVRLTCRNVGDPLSEATDRLIYVGAQLKTGQVATCDPADSKYKRATYLNWDWFKEMRGIWAVKKCQIFQIEESAGVDLVCKSSNPDVIGLEGRTAEYVEFKASGGTDEPVTLTCHEKASKDKYSIDVYTVKRNVTG